MPRRKPNVSKASATGPGSVPDLPDDARDFADLPFIDDNAVATSRGPVEVWAALLDAVDNDLCRQERNVVDVLWGTSSPGGFRVHRIEPARRIVLRGSHRFSRYELELAIREAGDGGTVLTARTRAAFDGLHGRLYRLLVISSGLHALATRRLLQGILRRHGATN